MAPISFNKKEQLRGCFDAFTDFRIYCGTEGGPAISRSSEKKSRVELTKVASGKYIRRNLMDLELSSTLLSTVGLSSSKMWFVEEITITPNRYVSVIKSPEEIKKLLDFTETFTYTQKGTNIEYLINITGTTNLVALISKYIEDIYVSQRVAHIRNGILATAPALLSSGSEIPQ